LVYIELSSRRDEREHAFADTISGRYLFHDLVRGLVRGLTFWRSLSA
jgi:hypothetical protein